MLKKLARLAPLVRKMASLRRRAAYRAERDYEFVLPALKLQLPALARRSLGELRILDFGCGYTYPMLVLLRDQVREIIGIDREPTYREGWVRWARECAGWQKPGTALEAAVDHRLAHLYFGELERRSGVRARHRGYRILRCDGRQVPLPDCSFDAIISTNVLQELPLPLAPFAREMARLLVRGGVVYLDWHSFFSPSGRYAGVEQERLEPWSHLHGEYYDQLNRITPDDVWEAFRPWFGDLQVLGHDLKYRIAGVDPEFEPEGAQCLTPEVEERLKGYSRELLMTRGYILTGRRTGAAASPHAAAGQPAVEGAAAG